MKYSLYLNALQNVIQARIDDEENKDLIKQNVFYGVKLINMSPEPTSYGTAVNNFKFASAIKGTAGLLTPAELMNVFPIEKEFKGHRWERKDYFYTINYIDSLDQDKPIGESATELFWEYHNWEITHFCINIMSLMSKIRQFQGKSSLAEEWADMNGIKTYTMHTDGQGKKYLLDSEGKTQKVNKPKPRRPKYLKAVK